MKKIFLTMFLLLTMLTFFTSAKTEASPHDMNRPHYKYTGDYRVQPAHNAHSHGKIVQAGFRYNRPPSPPIRRHSPRLVTGVNIGLGVGYDPFVYVSSPRYYDNYYHCNCPCHYYH